MLSEFRARLVGEGQIERLLDLMLDRLRQKGLVSRGGQQRTDATCVRSAVRDLNRLEQISGTLRAALEAVAVAAPDWLAAHAFVEWYEHYGARACDYRLPQATSAREELAATISADGFLLWETMTACDAPDWLVALPAVQTLRQVWIQQYYRDGSTIRWRGKGELPPAALIIGSP